jgi:hypothetical protein
MQTPPPANREPGSNTTWQTRTAIRDRRVAVSGSTPNSRLGRSPASVAGRQRSSPPPPQWPTSRHPPSDACAQRESINDSTCARADPDQDAAAWREFSVTNVTLEDQAHLEELTPKPGVKPLLVDGDAASQSADEQMRVTVVGKPKGRSCRAFCRAKIEVEKQTNHLWVAGTGRMMPLMEQDLNGRPLPRPQSVEITCQRRIFERHGRVRSRRARGLRNRRHHHKPIGTFDRPID